MKDDCTWREGPFADALGRGAGPRGRRQAQRAAHKLIDRARRAGHAELAGWLDRGYRDGTLTTEGAAADPEKLARTLAAISLCRFVESASGCSELDFGWATMAFDRADHRGRIVESMACTHDLIALEPGEIAGSVLAAMFGADWGGAWYRLRYCGLDELSPPPGGVGRSTLDAWDVLPVARRAREMPSGLAVFRTRFAWWDGGDDVFLARLEQGLTGDGGGLRLIGPPRFRPLSDSRIGADPWDRTLLDGFGANRLSRYLLARAGAGPG